MVDEFDVTSLLVLFNKQCMIFFFVAASASLYWFHASLDALWTSDSSWCWNVYSSCCCSIVCSSVGWWDNLWYYLSLFEPTTVVPYSVWLPMIIFCWPAPRTLVCNFLLISPLVLMLQITVGGCHYGWCLLDCFFSLTCGICGYVYYDLYIMICFLSVWALCLFAYFVCVFKFLLTLVRLLR